MNTSTDEHLKNNLALYSEARKNIAQNAQVANLVEDVSKSQANSKRAHGGGYVPFSFVQNHSAPEGVVVGSPSMGEDGDKDEIPSQKRGRFNKESQQENQSKGTNNLKSIALGWSKLIFERSSKVKLSVFL